MPSILPNKRFYTVKEVAKLLNFSTNTVYKYLDEGKIVSTRLGSEGRFRIPASEVSKLVQETGVQLPNLIQSIPISKPEPHIKGAPSLFDWFIGFLSMGLGFSQFIFPDYNLSSTVAPYIIYIKVLQIILFFAGVSLISFDVLRIEKGRRHDFTHIILGLIYFVLTILFFRSGSIPTAIGYLAAAVVIFLTAFKKCGEYLRFIIYINILYIFLGVALLTWPRSFLVGTMVTPSFGNLLMFFVFWLIGLGIILFLGIRAVKRRGAYMTILAFAISLLSLVYATFAFANGFWGRSIYCLILGAFAIIFPFSDHFQSFTLKSKKELLGSFAWLTGIFLIGSVVLYFIYFSFQNYILLELKNRVNTASDIAASFMMGNIERVTSFSQNADLIKFTKNKDLLNIDQELKLIYLSGNGALRRVVLIDSDGVIIDTYPYLISGIGVNVGDRDYFSAAKSSKGTNVTGILQPSTPGVMPAVLVTAPIYDASGNFLGVLSGSVDISELAKGIDIVKFGAAGRILLADSSKNYIIPPSPDEILTKVPDNSPVSMAIDGKAGTIQGYSMSGVLSFMAYKKIDNLGWGIVAEQPLSEAFASYSTTGFIIFLIFAMSGVCSLVFIIRSRKDNS